KRGGAKLLDVDHAVVGDFGLVEHVKLVGMVAPGEVARIDDHATEGGAVATHELSHGMNNHVGAVFDGAQENRRSYGIVNDEWNAMLVGNFREGFNIGDVSGRVADALAIDCASVF